ncbi:unnamed protein product [Trichogramma brassicae]|uniref:Uncharacterized protein n=1 Tax=Trichogramma brassicae TaxID=86971 RepID=A0A6H5I4X4_9HYME|nr:unnamed protein product [Trichogramma brassicae]
MPSSRLPRNLRPGPWRTSWSGWTALYVVLASSFIQGKSNLHKEVISYQVSLGIALSALRKSLESQVPPRPPVADKAVCTSPLFTGSATSMRLATSPPASHATPKRHAVTPASKQHDENNNEVGDQDGFVLVDRRHHRQRKQTAATPGAVHARQQPKPRPVQRRARHRPDVIVIKAKDASKYADILRSLKSDPTLQQKVGSSVNNIRRSAAGALMLQLKKGVENENRDQGLGRVCHQGGGYRGIGRSPGRSGF